MKTVDDELDEIPYNEMSVCYHRMSCNYEEVLPGHYRCSDCGNEYEDTD